MQTATFAGRRGITPAAEAAARVAGWRLVLDKPPLVPVGVSFANLVRDPDAETYGVLYDIGTDDLAHVELTEGVALANYRRIEIEAVPLAAAMPPVRAVTLVSEKHAADLQPSAQYMALLIEGATEHGLPAEWIARLAAIPTVPDTAEAIRVRALMDDVLAHLRR